jgi:hypothetical protein
MKGGYPMTRPEPVRCGYYTAEIEINGHKVPYMVFAASPHHAAFKVKAETGYMPKGEIQAPP